MGVVANRVAVVKGATGWWMGRRGSDAEHEVEGSGYDQDDDGGEGAVIDTQCHSLTHFAVLPRLQKNIIPMKVQILPLPRTEYPHIDGLIDLNCHLR